MKNVSLLLLLFAGTTGVFGQYREFKNTEGKALVALPLKKDEQTISLKTKDGKEYKVPISSLSEDDQKFIARWSPPAITTRVYAFDRPRERANMSPDPRRDFYIETGIKGGGFTFAPFQRQEIIDALKEFMKRCDKLDPAANPDYLKVELTNLNGRYQGSETVWIMILRKNRFELLASGSGRFPDHMAGVAGGIDLTMAPYYLEFISSYDAEGAARKYLETAEKIKRG